MTWFWCWDWKTSNKWSLKFTKSTWNSSAWITPIYTLTKPWTCSIWTPVTNNLSKSKFSKTPSKLLSRSLLLTKSQKPVGCLLSNWLEKAWLLELSSEKAPLPVSSKITLMESSWGSLMNPEPPPKISRYGLTAEVKSYPQANILFPSTNKTNISECLQ